VPAHFRKLNQNDLQETYAEIVEKCHIFTAMHPLSQEMFACIIVTCRQGLVEKSVNKVHNSLYLGDFAFHFTIRKVRENYNFLNQNIQKSSASFLSSFPAPAIRQGFPLSGGGRAAFRKKTTIFYLAIAFFGNIC
jgi:hypothetical protein